MNRHNWFRLRRPVSDTAARMQPSMRDRLWIAAVWLSALVAASVWTRAALVVNEVCYDNSAFADETGDTSSDWIELYNSGPGSVNVSNYGLGDSFTFMVNDGALDSSPATVTITVNPSGPVTVFEDNFESNKGWTRNPSGTDTATLGLWERANPEEVTYNGSKQLGTTASGSYDLVTGPLAGSSAGSYDIDGGITSIRSPSFALPAGKTPTLTFKYYMAHASNSSSSDYLRVKVVGATTTTVLQELGATNDDDAAWASFSGSLGTYAGQTVYLLIEAADASGASLVEAAIDDVKVVAQ